MRDTLTFDDVYAAYFQHVYRWIRALGGPEADLEDLTQETFLVVRAKLGAFDGRNPKAWLHRIARNVVSDHRRRAWFRRRAPTSDEVLEALPATDGEPSEALRRREAGQILERALAGMSALQREAFVLFELEGYTGEELAELQQVPLNTVYTRLHHARKRFLEHLAQLAEPREGKP